MQCLLTLYLFRPIHGLYLLCFVLHFSMGLVLLPSRVSFDLFIETVTIMLDLSLLNCANFHYICSILELLTMTQIKTLDH